MPRVTTSRIRSKLLKVKLNALQLEVRPAGWHACAQEFRKA
jgi:hypothetical protein